MEGPSLLPLLSLCTCVLRGDPGSILQLWYNGGYARSPSRMAMMAWQTVTTSEGGGRPCHQVLPFRLWLSLAFTQNKRSSYTVHIHAALGGGEPRWQPLYVAVAVAAAEWQDASRELPGRQQRRWRQTVATRQWRCFIFGWGWAAAEWRWWLFYGAGF